MSIRNFIFDPFLVNIEGGIRELGSNRGGRREVIFVFVSIIIELKISI